MNGETFEKNPTPVDAKDNNDSPVIDKNIDNTQTKNIDENQNLNKDNMNED